MSLGVGEAARRLEARGLLQRRRQSRAPKVIERVSWQLGRALPADLTDFYLAGVDRIGDFQALAPEWTPQHGWRDPEPALTILLAAEAAPVFDDGCGNLFGLDLMAGGAVPAVYFFDRARNFEWPIFAAASSLGAFLMILAATGQAEAEGWPRKWELEIDPDLERCPRAPAIWATR